MTEDGVPGFASTDPPWVVIARPGDPSVAAGLARFEEAGGVVRHLDGAVMRSEAELFAEFARVLTFPGYFGRNWDAVVDCLGDLHGDWHGDADVVVVVRSADTVLSTPFAGVFASVLCQGAERANASTDLDGLPLDDTPFALHFVLEAGVLGPREIVEAVTWRDSVVTRRGDLVLVT
ncbi:barstar family protein [Actinosynnema sp. NPDC020468]|uniref:barstar family protein n=1 Tax=Actinosynnema sp. NPDC020468 TaxID=3154488 RepID=UPI0033F993B1